MKRKVLFLIIPIIIFIVLFYVGYDYIKFELQKDNYIFNSNRYTYILSPDNSEYSFKFNTKRYMFSSKDYIKNINEIISSKYDSKVILKKITLQKNRVLLTISIDTKWNYFSGKCLSINEYIKKDLAPFAVGFVGVDVTCSDDNGKVIPSSVIGYGNEKGKEYFDMELSRLDFESYSFINIRFSGLNVYTYNRK